MMLKLINKCTAKRIILFVWIILTGCSNIKKISGKYLASGSSPTGYIFVKFKNNGTFYLESWMDVMGSTEENGNWQFKNDTLYLIKETSSSGKFLDYHYKYDSTSNVITIKLFIADLMPAVFEKVYLNNSKTPLKISSDGVYTVHTDSLKNLEIESLSKAKHNIELPKNKISEIFIYIDYSQSKSSIDLPKKWIKRGRKIISSDKEPMVFKKKLF